MLEPLAITSADGTPLEAEYRAAHGEVRAAAVLCHPHPQYGGSMRSVLIGELFRELPAHGVACVRFNFRGVEGSGGEYDDGRAERDDVAAAVAATTERIDDSVPLVLAGWSFGADMALSTVTPRLSGWFAVAPPLWFVDGSAPTGTDPRPKRIVLGERDQVRAPADVECEVAAWVATTTTVVAGADHFFLGRSDQVVDAAVAFIDRPAPT
jgi:alpha/beta superfamily hydrolase